jgi:SAM-dependent methyltransferase
VSLPFSLPAPAGSDFGPEWNGREFVLGDVRSPVLEYSENFAGWSDDLTALHEEAAGDNHPVDVASRRNAIAEVRKAIHDTKPVIMEIGCSSGFLISELVASFPDACVIGADVVKDPLYRLAKRLPGVPLIRFDLLQCPLPAQSVDVLIMLNVLEHIEDDVGAMRQAFQLLKPGGVLIAEVPAGKALYDSYDEELQHFRRYASSELTDKLSAVGFAVCRKSHLGFILFPAFAAVKLMNKRASARKHVTVVREQAASTASNGLVRVAMEIESRWLSRFHLPFGIRALATARRPA